MDTLLPLLKKLFVVVIISSIVVIGNILLAPKACSKPVTFSIEFIDPRFNIAKSTVSAHLKEAEELWNAVVPEKTLLRFVETGGDVQISFIYDERQRTTIRNERLKRQIAEQKSELTYIRSSLTENQETYEAKNHLIQEKTSAYLTRVEAYKEKVEEWNKKGGAPAPIYDELKQEQLAIELERLSLNKEIEELNLLAENIKNKSGKHNTIVKEVNEKVDTINQTALKEFEEGIYDPTTRKITIYEFESPLSLKRVLAHELGHALDIPHVEGKDSIMYPYNDSLVFELSEEDKQALRTICTE